MDEKKGSKGINVRRIQQILHLHEDGIFGEVTEEAVKDFQFRNGLTKTGVVNMTTWRALGIEAETMGCRRTIKEVIVHCTATMVGKPYTVEQIRRQHKQQGWADIGYHYVIYADGSLHAGRPLNEVGAHCKGHNTYSIGVCYVGGLDKDGKPADTRTKEQKEQLKSLIDSCKALYKGVKIHGHNEFAAKACPCFDVKKEYG